MKPSRQKSEKKGPFKTSDDRFHASRVKNIILLYEFEYHKKSVICIRGTYVASSYRQYAIESVYFPSPMKVFSR